MTDDRLWTLLECVGWGIVVIAVTVSVWLFVAVSLGVLWL